jgi:dihydrofolate reductase
MIELPPVSMSVAMTPKGVIGNKGVMPWKSKRDMRRFVDLTEGLPVVMGPKTYLSLPDKSRPLPNRRNIVLTTNRDYQAPSGVLVAHSPRQAVEYAAVYEHHDVFVIGGSMVYNSFLADWAQTLYVTYVWSEEDGDTHFPYWDKSEWREVWTEKKWRKEAKDTHFTRFAEYRRVIQPLQNIRHIWRLSEKT